MTNDLLIYDGRRDEWFRVVAYRYPKKGETYIGQADDGEVMVAGYHYSQSRHILQPCPPPPPSKEWLDLRETAELLAADGISRHDGASIFTQVRILQLDAVADSLAALPSTEPEERFRVSFVFGKYAVYGDGDWRGDFLTEQDAKDFAAMKNQEANQ